MYYGVQYYPEHWPKERWPVDAEMMQRAGVNVVRMGEFAWSAYEPREGAVDFSWMEEAIELLGRHGIKTILCTCSRTPPPWVYRKYPGILNVNSDGRPAEKDSRYRIGHAHPEFVALSQKIDEAVIRHFSGNDNIAAWQVDNEVGSGNDCFCPVCLKQFHAYLKDKYSTTDALNAAWGSHFWSFAINEFEEVPMAAQNPQLVLEYRRFMSWLNTEFTRWRSELIRKCDPGKQVTTNFQNIHAAHTDWHQMAKVIDVNGMNHYPSRTPELAIDFYRGRRGTVWALEQHTRLRDVDTPDGWMRLWAWLAVAHGANAIVHFRWRQCRWGAEQFCDGILPHSGEENRFYHDLSRMGREIKKIGALIDETRPCAKVAVIYSYESRWGVQVSGLGREMGPVLEATDYHKALARRVTSVDAMDTHEDLSDYDLVIAPRLWVVDSAIAANLTAFVENGGTLCLTAGSGVVDEYGKCFDVPRPGGLAELAGVTVSDLAFQNDLRLELASTAVPGLDGAVGSLVADEIHMAGAEAVVTHRGGWRDGMPAVTLYSKGKGRVVYVGVRLDQQAIGSLVEWLCGISSIRKSYARPDGVSIYERVGPRYRLMFLINWSGGEKAVELGGGWSDVFSGESFESLVIPANDLRILRCAAAGD